MAEFKEIWKQWRRMCKAFNECDGNCVDLCALAHNPVCGDLPNATDKDLENAEAVIMEWANENPEQIYPTWGEYLGRDINNSLGPYIRLAQEIPADIAEKLGITPKEG